MNREDYRISVEYQPLAPHRTPLRVAKRLLGLGVAVAAAAILVALYFVLPAIILAVPALAVAAGVFQFATGLTLFEADEQLSSMSLGRQAAVVITTLLILGVVLGAFMWFVVVTSGA